MSQQELINQLVKVAESYHQADQSLEVACNNGEDFDPVACTVYARKGMFTNQIPPESQRAAECLREVTELHGRLMKEHGMDSDAVRAIWLPILNQRF